MRFIEVANIIDEWSPLGIPSGWCGVGEYDDYTQEVWEAVMQNNHITHIYQVVYNVFNDIFDKDRFECREIAEKIATLAKIKCNKKKINKNSKQYRNLSVRGYDVYKHYRHRKSYKDTLRHT
jgi:hypothetical protein